MRGVILAGGKGTRLGELVKITNKHLLPIGEWPMIYYPLKKMSKIGIYDILLVSGTEHMGDFVELLGSGKDHNCSLTYKVQDEAGGIAQALGLARLHCNNDRCLVILGDNIFYDKLDLLISDANNFPNCAWIGLKKVPDPSRYGVATILNDQIINIIEKPEHPISDYAVVGIYIYPPDVFDVIKSLRPSGRGELEITDVNNYYIKNNRIGYTMLDGYWTDAGTIDSLNHANELVRNKFPII